MSMHVAAFANQVHGKSDEEILQIARIGLGVESLLNMTFRSVTEAVVAIRDGTLRWELSEGDTKHTYNLTVGKGQAVLTAGDGGPASTTIAASVPDFFRVVAGGLEWKDAVADGRLKITGDARMLPDDVGPLLRGTA